MLRSFSLVPRRIRARISDRKLRTSRLIACDLDGTLLNADNMVGARTGQLIRQITAIGVEFVFITARHHFAAEPFADDLNLDHTIISLDGALTMHPHSDVPISMIPIDRQLVSAVAARVREVDRVECVMVMSDRICLSNGEMVVPGRHIHWNIDREVHGGGEWESDPVLELIATGTFRAVNEVYSIVKPLERDAGVRLRLYESDSHGDLWYLEIRSIEAGKLRALSDYTHANTISLNDVVAIGDARNDIEFCEKSGYTVAVRNAVPRLLEIADFITERGCKDEGINEFLEYFLTVRRQNA